MSLAIAGAFSLLLAGGPAVDRQIAVTFDDLPGPRAAVVSNDPEALRQMTRKLLEGLRAATVPVVGFVNEGKLVVEGEGPEGLAARTALLDLWLEAGHDLGNHTFSHRSFNSTPLEDFEADVLRGEVVTRRLMQARGRTLRYFRHPFLRTGTELPKKRALEAFLKDHGYQVAPVTVDNDEYIYAAVYAHARRRGDDVLARRIAGDYVRYMEEMLAFDEGVAQTLLGRPVAHVLLLHANTLNSETFPELAAMMKRRGYRFVTLEDALKDEAYRLPDDYVGERGWSWLHRWELGAGKPRTPSPEPPGWVTDAYRLTTTR
jgi:peptidoglycan-N-acetylglucosamine deacetylase